MKKHYVARLNIFSKIFKIGLVTILFLFAFPLPKSDHKLNHKISTQNRLIGNFDPTKNKNFRLVPKGYTKKKTYLRDQTLTAFLKMARAATRDDVQLTILSGFRSFRYQKKIWDRKYKKFIPIYKTIGERVNAILRYSAYPGTSRHHWGSEIDLNSLNNLYFTKTKQGKKVKAWLDRHAHNYGFFLTYTPTFQRTGYNTELWHYSHYPVSSKIMYDYFLYISPKTIQMLEQKNTVNLKKIFKEYVLGINPTLLRKMELDGLPIKIDY